MLLPALAYSQVVIDTVAYDDTVRVGTNKINANFVKLQDSLNAALVQIVKNMDSLVAHRGQVNKNLDSLVTHRTALNKDLDSILVHGPQIYANVDSIAAHLTQILKNMDSLIAHRTAINANIDSLLSHGTQLGAKLDSASFTGDAIMGMLNEAVRSVDSSWTYKDTLYTEGIFSRNEGNRGGGELRLDRYGGAGATPLIFGLRARGTYASPAIVQVGDQLFNWTAHAQATNKTVAAGWQVFEAGGVDVDTVITRWVLKVMNSSGAYDTLEYVGGIFSAPSFLDLCRPSRSCASRGSGRRKD
jgi:hypothetical protein